MKITPFIIGSGLSGKTIARSLGIVNALDPRWEISSPVFLPRNSSLTKTISLAENPVLFIANPHGLHARVLLESSALPFKGIFCEKPVAVNLEEVRALGELKREVAVYHGYRATWGAQTLRKLVASGELGKIFSVEGRYWQSSAAEKALSGKAVDSWKNEIALGGAYDVLLDLSTHWVDLVTSILGQPLASVKLWRNFTNAEAPHRDTHVHLNLNYQNGAQAMVSVSKTAHGYGNELTVQLFGSLGSASWSFQNPDEIVIGQGANRKVLTRKENTFGSHSPSFHAMGWIEGYIEITHQALREMIFAEKGEFPRLSQSVDYLEKLFSADAL